MGLEEAKVKFEKLATVLQDAVPAGKEDELNPKAFELVPAAVRDEAMSAVEGLSDDDAFACVNQLTARAGLRKEMGMVVCAYFSNPFWKDLFARANKSAAAAAKRAGK